MPLMPLTCLDIGFYCKCQYKNVVFLSYKNVGKPTFLYDIFRHPQSCIAIDPSTYMKDHLCSQPNNGAKVYQAGH